MEQRIRTLADALYQAEQNRTVVKPLTSEAPDLTVEDAYNIQMINVERKLSHGDKVVGHKVGLTSKPMQEMLGVGEPDFGHLFRSMHFQNDDVVGYPVIQPKVEPELAFILKEDLPDTHIGIQDVLRATRFVLPAIEVIDSRIADWKIKLADTVADNASSGCFVLSDMVTGIDATNLTTVGAVMKVNGQVVETGAGAAVIGHPALAVAWLANKLASLGTALRAGDIILSGAVSKAVAVQPGDHVSLSFGKLGRVSFTLGAKSH